MELEPSTFEIAPGSEVFVERSEIERTKRHSVPKESDDTASENP